MKKLVLGVVFVLCSQIIFAQNESEEYQERKNIVKLNVTALAFTNFNFQYERVLTRRSSLALGISTIPKRGIPFSDKIESSLIDGNDEFSFKDAKIGYFSITPEYRLYLGKGYGKGFYFAPYFRYSKISVDGISFSYKNDLGIDELATVKGEVAAKSFGLMLGVSFNLSESLVLDWWILGAGYGSVNTNMDILTEFKLSPTEQEIVRKEIKDLDIPQVNENITINENGGNVKIDSFPWLALRSGLCLGFRF